MSRNLNRARWDLIRFGLSPGKLISRMISRDVPKILCVSIPKSGTHLLERALCIHPHMYRKLIPTLYPNNIDAYGGFDALMSSLRPGQILAAHLWYSPAYIESLRIHNVRCLFMIRDPRDVVVSMAFYLSNQRRHALHAEFTAKPEFEDRIKLAVLGSPAGRLKSIGQKLESYAGWLSSDALAVRFEDLVGARGGGTEARQAATLRSIFSYLEIDVRDDEIDRYARNLFSPLSPTFRKGGIGQWRDYFNDEIEGLYQQETEAWLSVYGY
jgi:hypothetical protein